MPQKADPNPTLVGKLAAELQKIEDLPVLDGVDVGERGCGIFIAVPQGDGDLLIRFPDGESLSAVSPTFAEVLEAVQVGQDFLEVCNIRIGMTARRAETDEDFEKVLHSMDWPAESTPQVMSVISQQVPLEDLLRKPPLLPSWLKAGLWAFAGAIVGATAYAEIAK